MGPIYIICSWKEQFRVNLWLLASFLLVFNLFDLEFSIFRLLCGSSKIKSWHWRGFFQLLPTTHPWKSRPLTSTKQAKSRLLLKIDFLKMIHGDCIASRYTFLKKSDFLKPILIKSRLEAFGTGAESQEKITRRGAASILHWALSKKCQYPYLR